MTIKVKYTLISPVSLQVAGEAPLFPENRKIKFCKIHCTMDHKIDECYEVIRMVKL